MVWDGSIGLKESMAAAAAPQLEEPVVVEVEPFSPSLFLDLPPTPHDDDPNDDDLLLPFISRMLMEDDIDDKFFYQFPDHPALLNAQQPYAQILEAPSDDTITNTTNSSDDSASAATTTWPYDPIELSQLLQSPPHPVFDTLDGGATKSAPDEDADLFAGADNMEMLNMAFLKGREEANKFLPTNNTLFAAFDSDARLKAEPVLDDPTLMFGGSGGRGRKNRHCEEDDLEAETGRSSKLMVPPQEDTAAAREMLDEIMFNGYEVIMKGMDELRVAMDSEAEKKARNGGGAGRRADRAKAAVVDLRTLLIHCAQAVATGDRRSATELLKQVKQNSSPRGDATQRLACCFAEGLEARLAGTGSQVYQSLVAKRTSTVDFLKAYKLFTAACCIKKVNVIFSNKTICDAVAGKRKLHIVDYGLCYGFQWPGLFKFLSEREGGPPEVRITGIDLPQPGFRPAQQIEETGRRLSNCARQFGVPFKFQAIAAKWETVRREDLHLDVDSEEEEEVLVVNCLHGLNALQDESVVVDSPSPRDMVLNNIRDMRPVVFIQCVVNGAYGAPFFVTRFREALFHYSAQFDMLDATIPRDNDERLLIERDLLGRWALNVIACEGADRVDRPETYKQWQVRNHRAGLTQLPLEPQVVELVRHKVKNLYHKDFVIDVDHNWLLQGWKGRILYAMSAWEAMAASPKLEVEPFSPSLFLDLPPTPTPHDDDHNNDDLLLPFISRMLMEDDIHDKFFYHFPDHPALLHTQQSYAQILHAPSSSSDDTTNNNTSNSSVPDHDGYGGATQSAPDLKQLFARAHNMEMLNMAFLKGREEAIKFLPTNKTLFAGFDGAARLKEEPTFMFIRSGGRGRKNKHGEEDDLDAETSRSSKLMVPEHEDTAEAGKIFDEIILNGYQMIIKGIDDLRVSMGSEADEKARNGLRASRAKTAVVDLHTLLIHCAQAVATGDRRSATQLLNQIKQHSSPRGDATQRLACCFAEGLEARLAGTGSQVYQSLMAKRTSTVDFLKAYKLFTAACCVNKVNIIFSNKTIHNAVAGRHKLHIVDYGLGYGFQWPALFLLLGAREGGPPEVRMTGIDVPQPGFRPADQIEETGRRLSNWARQFGVPFKFQAIAAKWETVRREDLGLDVDPEEVLVVNCLHGLNNLQEESPRDMVLNNIRDMRPDVFVQCVVNGAYGAPFFVTRFREALFHYSAQFDMLDATIPRDNDERLLIERDLLGRWALNVIACEGADRVDRPETYKQWQVRNHRAGLTQLPLEPQVVELVRHKVKSLYHKDFVIDVDHNWLLQGWKGRILYAMSAWDALFDDDMVLPYISRLLMEDDVDDHFFYQYPDHPALLHAQQPFAQILDDEAATAAFPTAAVHFDAAGDKQGSLDMVNMAFLKGMEEANKFLPTNTSSLILLSSSTLQLQGEVVVDGAINSKKVNCRDDDLEVTRATKLMAPEPELEEEGAREMFDEMMLQEHEICMKGVKQLSLSVGTASENKSKSSSKKPRGRRTVIHTEPVDLHNLLLHCAQAVATDDRRSAHELLRQIKQHSSPWGDAGQRLAHCFAQGLEARLAGTGSQVYRSLMSQRTSVVDFLKAYRLYMEACCCKKVAFVFSNKTIYDAVAGRSRLHIVDYGLSYGFQWPGLLRELAARRGGPPEVRITGIDLPQPGFRPDQHIEETGRRLSKYADELGVPFKFQGIAATRKESVRLEELEGEADEVVVVISLCHFRSVMDESLLDRRSPRDEVLSNIRRMRPDVFIHGIMNAAYGATYFLTRFREALYYYAAQFDLLDATVARDSHERMLVERDIFGRAALNVIACEGAERVERPEMYKQWQARNQRAGLRQLPLNPQVVRLVLDKVRDKYHKDFVVDEDQRWLLHRWKGRVLYALSTWVAQHS
uniref:GRAS family transcription factor n=1 Tax=Oryza punctata TaxID=4537 RepID=A0A0E0MIE4_ORYPU